MQKWYFTKVNDSTKMSRVNQKKKCIEIRELYWWEKIIHWLFRYGQHSK